MDFKPSFCILTVSAVFTLVQSDVTTLPPKTSKTSSVTLTTATTKVSSTGNKITQSTSLKSTGTTIPTTMAPVNCIVGRCDGDACSNGTVIEAFKSQNCATGVCVTEKTETKGKVTYNFKCSTKDCEADKKSASNGTKVTCCSTKDCNKLTLENSATRLLSTFTAVMTFFLINILV